MVMESENIYMINRISCHRSNYRTSPRYPDQAGLAMMSTYGRSIPQAEWRPIMERLYVLRYTGLKAAYESLDSAISGPFDGGGPSQADATFSDEVRAKRFREMEPCPAGGQSLDMEDSCRTRCSPGRML